MKICKFPEMQNKSEVIIKSAMFDVFIFIFPHILPRYGIYICSTCTQLCMALTALTSPMMFFKYTELPHWNVAPKQTWW